jgi:hypothetical protein
VFGFHTRHPHSLFGAKRQIFLGAIGEFCHVVEQAFHQDSVLAPLRALFLGKLSHHHEHTEAHAVLGGLALDKAVFAQFL